MYTSGTHGAPLTAAPRAPSRSQEDERWPKRRRMTATRRHQARLKAADIGAQHNHEPSVQPNHDSGPGANPLRPAVRLSQPHRRRKGSQRRRAEADADLRSRWL